MSAVQRGMPLAIERNSYDLHVGVSVSHLLIEAGFGASDSIRKHVMVVIGPLQE